MSSADLAVSALKGLTALGRRALLVVESAMERYDYVPATLISSAIHVSPDRGRELLDSLSEQGLLRGIGAPYRGYSLTYAGADLLALRTLAERDVLEALGKPIGVGKESDVYEGLSGGEAVAVKFHRVGRTSFRQTRRLRGYEGGEARRGWIARAKRAAEMEFNALRILYKGSVSVPRPVYRARHVVIMSALEGVLLQSYKGELGKPEVEEVFRNVRMSVGAGVVHSDLSEYNVLISEDGRITLIDFPQWVRPSHRDAERYLRRDVENLLRFLSRRRYPAPTTPSAISFVKGETSSLEWQ